MAQIVGMHVQRTEEGLITLKKAHTVNYIKIDHNRAIISLRFAFRALHSTRNNENPHPFSSSCTSDLMLS
jgi:hypothetical protein